MRVRSILPLILLLCLGLTACEDSTSPELPSRLTVESGNGQFSRRATALSDPLVVRLRYENGSIAADHRIRFEVGTLGGTLSSASANTNAFGLASTRLTLPDQVGTARVRAYLEDDPGVYADFTATSSEFFCPEEDPTFVRKFTSNDPVFNDVFLFTRKSGLFNAAGVVRLTPAPSNGEFNALSLVAFSEDVFLKVIHDAEFSAAGDFYLAWNHQRLEAVRPRPDSLVDVTGFTAGLESLYGSEISVTPNGILAGCDEFGPFTIGCRDTLARYAGAMYAGVDGGDYASGDAVAVDPGTEDIYYIHVTGLKLKRLPIDNGLATGPPVDVTDLTADEAQGCSGMIVDGADGSVFMLVDTENTRQLIKVTSAGTKTTAVNFLTHPATMAAPGRQNDLAIDRQFRFLYTLDRLNNALILYEIVSTQVTVMVSDGDPEAASRNTEADERVGLAVVPRNGL